MQERPYEELSIRLLGAVLVCAPLVGGTQAPADASNLVGSWRLVAYEDKPASGHRLAWLRRSQLLEVAQSVSQPSCLHTRYFD